MGCASPKPSQSMPIKATSNFHVINYLPYSNYWGILPLPVPSLHYLFKTQITNNRFPIDVRKGSATPNFRFSWKGWFSGKMVFFLTKSVWYKSGAVIVSGLLLSLLPYKIQILDNNSVQFGVLSSGHASLPYKSFYSFHFWGCVRCSTHIMHITSPSRKQEMLNKN